MSRPNGAPGAPSLYVSKYLPATGFTTPTLVTPATNSTIQAAEVSIDSSGRATVVAAGTTCASLNVTATTVDCSSGVPAIYSFSF
jgi:hypothetical protein